MNHLLITYLMVIFTITYLMTRKEYITLRNTGNNGEILFQLFNHSSDFRVSKRDFINLYTMWNSRQESLLHPMLPEVLGTLLDTLDRLDLAAGVNIIHLKNIKIYY